MLRRPTALSIGNFDGVHLGHRAMLSQVVEAARAHALVPTVLTFEPHPRQFFAEKNRRPELSPPQINGLRDKLSALGQASIEQLLEVVAGQVREHAQLEVGQRADRQCYAV